MPGSSTMLGSSEAVKASRVFWLAIVALLCQLPFAIVYFISLSRFAHYEFFPVVLGAIAWLLWRRWAGQISTELWRLQAARSLILLAALAATCALSFLSPWMGYVGILSASAAALLLTRCHGTQTSLVTIWILLAVLWQPPYSSKLTLDIILTSVLQRVSTQQVSNLLDMLQIAHVNLGTVISIPGLDMGVEEACSGVQSLFLYFAMAAMCSVYFQRSWMHAGILILSALLWALITNTLRILAIALAMVMGDMDLTHGFPHELLGYLMMSLGILLIASFDQFLLVILPNRTIDQQLSSWQELPRPGLQLLQPTFWIAIIPFLLVFVGQLTDISSVLKTRKSVNFFGEQQLIAVQRQWLPEQFGDWKLVNYERTTRSLISDLGQQSDAWIYDNGQASIIVSFDQVFPGWHELTRCYEGQGWTCLERSVATLGGVSPHDFGIRGQFSNQQGEQGFLMFAFLGRSGEVLEAPGQWNLAASLFYRIRNRLSPRLRGSLFGETAYQVQVFTVSPSAESELDSLLLQAMRHFRTHMATAK